MSASVQAPRIDARMVFYFAFLIVFTSGLLFLAAGTLRWTVGWIFVLLYAFMAVGSRYLVAQRHPDLLQERGRAGTAPNAQKWDRVLAPLVSLGGSIALLVVAGLDHRYGWSPEVPIWVVVVAFVAFVAAFAFSVWAMLANRFFSAVVRIQSDRGHTVVSEGPYRIVRHPGYAAAVVVYLAMPVALGALWALVPAALTIILTVVRTALEDRLLQAELPGYAEYARRTRWRLLPGVW